MEYKGQVPETVTEKWTGPDDIAANRWKRAMTLQMTGRMAHTRGNQAFWLLLVSLVLTALSWMPSLYGRGLQLCIAGFFLVSFVRHARTYLKTKAEILKMDKEQFNPMPETSASEEAAEAKVA